MTRTFTKWSHLVTDVNTIESVIDRAFHIALSGKPGVVHIDLPKDVLSSIVAKRNPFIHDDTRKLNPETRKFGTPPDMLAVANIVTDNSNTTQTSQDQLNITNLRTNPLSNDSKICQAATSKYRSKAPVSNHKEMQKISDNSETCQVTNSNNQSYSTNSNAVNAENPSEYKTYQVTSSISQSNGARSLTTKNLKSNKTNHPQDDHQTNSKYYSSKCVDSKIKKVIGLLNNAKQPVIIAGKGCNTSSALLRGLAIAGNIPVTTTLHGIGSFDETHQLSLQMLGMLNYMKKSRYAIFVTDYKNKLYSSSTFEAPLVSRISKLKYYNFPVSTRRRFDVDSTLFGRQ